MKRHDPIHAAQNPRFKRWRKCVRGQVRKAGVTLASGARICLELAADPKWETSWIAPNGWDQPLPDPGHGGLFELSAELFRELDTFNTKHPLLEVVLPEAPPDTPPFSKGMALVVPFQDPRNVGAVIRSAVGLGVPMIYLWPTCANPFHPTAVRTSAGAVFRAQFGALESLDTLADRGVEILALDAHGDPLHTVDLSNRCALMPGLEGPGLPEVAQNIPVRRVSLPMANVESYNATVAASIALYEWRTRRERV